MTPQAKLQENELPKEWEDWSKYTDVCSTVSDIDAVYDNGYWSVRVWRNVSEGGWYGSPNESQTWCVELKNKATSDVTDGWFYEDGAQAYDKAMRLMKDH